MLEYKTKKKTGQLLVSLTSMKQMNTDSKRVRDIRFASPNLLDMPTLPGDGKRKTEPAQGSGHMDVEPANKKLR